MRKKQLKRICRTILSQNIESIPTFQTIRLKYMESFHDLIMVNPDRSKLFEETLKKAKEGDFYNYENWLLSHEINPKTLKLDYIRDQFINKNPEYYIGNDQEILLIAEKIGLFLNKKPGSYQIPIIGCKGFGKTLLLSLIFKLGITNAPINREKKFSLESYFGRNKLPDAFYSQPPDTAVRLLDDCGEYDDIVYTINNVIKENGEALFITTWDPENWLYVNETFKDDLPFEDVIILEPFSDSELSAYLDRLFDLIWITELYERPLDLNYPLLINYQKFSKENMVNILMKYTMGIPMIITDLIFRCFKLMFKLNKSVLDEKIFKLAAEKMDIENQIKKISDLTPQHVEILKRLLLDKNKDGTRPVDLLDEFELDKSTISYHLSKLVKNEIIVVRKMGKSSFYKVKDHLIPFIQLRLLNRINLKNKNREE